MSELHTRQTKQHEDIKNKNRKEKRKRNKRNKRKLLKTDEEVEFRKANILGLDLRNMTKWLIKSLFGFQYLLNLLYS